MLLYALALILPDPTDLGGADYNIREAAHRRYANPITAHSLPARADCPEIDRRVKELRTHYLRWGCPVFCERQYREDDWRRWVCDYLATGRSLLAYDHQTFLFFFGDGPRTEYLFSKMRLAPGTNGSFLAVQLHETDYPRWCEYLDYHHWRAPMPRPK